MVALCSRCHDEAPDVTSPDIIWMWMQSTCSVIHGDIWANRIIGGMRKQDVQYLAAMGNEGTAAMMGEAAKMVGLHCGQGNQGAYIKTSSWVAAMSISISDHRQRQCRPDDKGVT